MGLWEKEPKKMVEIATLGAGIGAGAAGGIFGLIGSAIGRGFNFFEKRESHKRAIQLEEMAIEREGRNHAHEITLHKMNQEAAKAETEREISLIDIQGQYALKNSSMKDQEALSKGVSASANMAAILSIVRPVLTLTLLVMSMIIFWASSDTVRSFMAKETLFLTVMAVSWWFGDRSQKRCDWKDIKVLSERSNG